MTKEETNLIIAEQNKSTEEILKAVAKVKSDYHELCNLKDMRIKELEQKLEKTEKDLADYQFNYPTIKELEQENARLTTNEKSLLAERKIIVKENAELNRQLEEADNATDCFNRQEEIIEQAKELLKNIIRVTWGEGWNYSLDWKVKAEQFLKEI